MLVRPEVGTLHPPGLRPNHAFGVGARSQAMPVGYGGGRVQRSGLSYKSRYSWRTLPGSSRAPDPPGGRPLEPRLRPPPRPQGETEIEGPPAGTSHRSPGKISCRPSKHPPTPAFSRRLAHSRPTWLPPGPLPGGRCNSRQCSGHTRQSRFPRFQIGSPGRHGRPGTPLLP